MATEEATLDIEEEPVALVCEQHGLVATTRWLAADPEQAIVSLTKIHLLKEQLKHPIAGPECDLKIAEVEDVE